jgi:hypothetical protein
MINEDLPHHFRGQCEEMGSVLPICRLLVYQAKVGFVNKGGRLQCEVTPLSGKVPLRNSAKFIVNKGNQRFSGRDIALIPAGE